MAASPRLLLMMAMEAEADPVRRALGITATGRPVHPRFPFVLYHQAGRAIGAGVTTDIAVAVYGTDPRFGVDAIGTQPAAVATTLAAAETEPTLIVSAGTAGGFANRGGAIGSVYLSAAPVVFHDRRIPLGAFEPYGVGSYPTIGTDKIAEAAGVEPGVVTTGNSLDAPAVDRATMESAGAHAKDMEAAAVAWVAESLGVDFAAVKAITDLIDTPEPTADQFERNLTHATERLAEMIPAVLRALLR
ncbi:MAG: hypothetical protein HKN26_10805 [Acidimicrobiales bacterium]|nr:hypothetical protein [Acidimicrobiales bacterium]